MLHAVFGFSYTRIATIVGRSESVCRQLRSRAHRHVGTGRPRSEADRLSYARSESGSTVVVA
ncbi:hypothetical protein [Streptomyces smyrnaeus]|uniref:hypothetical protein n=1 Tax=Streptomyces smyrnaeus TaxID=1387713 RepID=UPI003F4CE87A